MTKMRVWVALWLVAGCAPKSLIVTVQPGDPPEMEWDGGNAHDVIVWRCQSDCDVSVCGRVVPFEGGGAAVWQVGVYEAASEAPIASPLTYGDPDVPGDEKRVDATPLESGEVYAVEVYQYSGCTFGDSDCIRFDAKGCTVFTQP